MQDETNEFDTKSKFTFISFISVYISLALMTDATNLRCNLNLLRTSMFSAYLYFHNP